MNIDIRPKRGGGGRGCVRRNFKSIVYLGLKFSTK
jgi:hypothetical protein